MSKLVSLSASLRRNLYTSPQRRIRFPFLNFDSEKNEAELGTNIRNTMKEFDNDMDQYIHSKPWQRQQPTDEKEVKPFNEVDADKYQKDPLASGISLLSPNELIKMESFFDSHGVYKQFKAVGFTDKQALALMKYNYLVLENKLKWLHSNYSPKVDVENEAYLFHAAHSELLFETTTTREKTLMDLTNAMIILKRAFNALEDESSAQIKLNDDIIKMEINQFRHENNLHQRLLNLKNSDLNSRILSEIVSGLKSEIESFRWELTRAGILCIIVMTLLIMGTWNLTKKNASAHDTAFETGGPLLVPLHEATDEESHDYEADWDDKVNVQVKR